MVAWWNVLYEPEELIIQSCGESREREQVVENLEGGSGLFWRDYPTRRGL